MALISSVGASSSDGGSSVTTGAIDTSTATLLVVHVADYVGATASTISDSKSNTWTPLTAIGSSTMCRSHLFYCSSPSVGSGHTFTATKVSGNTYPSIEVSAWTGAPTYDQESGHAQTTVPTDNQPGSLTPPVDNCLFVTGLCYEISELDGNVTIDSSFTKLLNNNFTSGQAMGGAFGYFEQTTAAAKNPKWDYASSIITAATMATFKPSGGGGGGTGCVWKLIGYGGGLVGDRKGLIG
jgi:hypothetical protein